MVKSERVGAIANLSKRTPFVRHNITDTVAHLAAAFKPCCRVPIFDGDKLLRVLSPADFLYILEHWKVLSEIERKEGSEFKEISRKQILTILESESLLKALALMERHGYSAIPIVSENNLDHVLEVITVKDIKFLCTAHDFLKTKNILNDPAFVKFVRKNNIGRTEEWAFLGDDAKLEDIIHLFLDSKIHRIILKDNRGKVTGMVALTDVMRNLADVLGSFDYRVPSSNHLPTNHPAHNKG